MGVARKARPALSMVIHPVQPYLRKIMEKVAPIGPSLPRAVYHRRPGK
jgi:hypothetical protein